MAPRAKHTLPARDRYAHYLVSTPPIKVFVGSSGEAEVIGRHIQAELERLRDLHVEVTVWTQGVFEAGSYTLESLVRYSKQTDFAVLVATPDDTVTRPGRDPRSAPRDNVIFELGLFIGSIGPERSYIVADRTDGAVSLPSDLDGVTWLPYKRRSDGNERAAVNDAVLSLAQRIKTLGAR